MPRALLASLSAAVLAGTLAGCAVTTTDETPEATEQTGSAEELHWTHAEADQWPGTCASGTRQSPVDLADAVPEDLADVEFDYRDSRLHIANTGHTIQAGYEPGSSITVDGDTFELVQLHAHAPSEHTIDGVHAAAELHLVHQDPAGNLAVVGVLVEQGPANAAIAPVLTDVPEQPGAERRPGGQINATDLLPADHSTLRYDGSLTTPPCTEGVRWLVMAEPATWSAQQLAAFTRLYDGSNRPVQPRGERPVLADTTD